MLAAAVVVIEPEGAQMAEPAAEDLGARAQARVVLEAPLTPVVVVAVVMAINLPN
jgi:hypothetical protein